MFVDLIRFEDFELDGRNYSLRRSGANLKLERIPMELLLLLAGHAGELVTREQISTLTRKMPSIPQSERFASRSVTIQPSLDSCKRSPAEDIAS
jgi:DNA-binding response OmpR family regulator